MDNARMLEKIARFCLMDDTFFNICMDGSLECVQLILRIIMNNESLAVQSIVTQRTIGNLQNRGVRFDVMAISEGKVYDIEIQRTDAGAVPKRARYNSSMIDANVLRSGQNFNELPESYVIFITEHDILGDNLPIYNISMVIAENGKSFEDGRHIIYVNGENRNNTALGKLMQDFFSKNPNEMNYKELKTRAKYFKEDEEGVKKMCEILQEIYDEGKIEGKIEGEMKTRIELVIDMLKANQSLDLITKFSKLTVEKINEIAKENHIVISK